MAVPTPEQAAANWASKLAGSTDRIKAGIQAVTVSPGTLAAKASSTWAQNTAAAQSKYQRNVGNVTLQQWQDAALNKGVARIPSGATSGQPKMQAFMAQFLPAVSAAVQALPPRGSFDQNVQRSVAMQTALHKFQYNKSGS